MTTKHSRFDSAGWGVFVLIFLLATGLIGFWLYANRANDQSESQAAPYVVAVFLGAIIAAVLTAILNSILQFVAAKRAPIEDVSKAMDKTDD